MHSRVLADRTLVSSRQCDSLAALPGCLSVSGPPALTGRSPSRQPEALLMWSVVIEPGTVETLTLVLRVHLTSRLSPRRHCLSAGESLVPRGPSPGATCPFLPVRFLFAREEPGSPNVPIVPRTQLGAGRRFPALTAESRRWSEFPFPYVG